MISADRKRSIKKMSRVIALGVSLPYAGLVLFQNKLMYHPTRYPDEAVAGKGFYDKFIPYKTSDGLDQWGMLITPEPNAPAPPRPSFYIAFNGNASTSMGLSDEFQRLANRTGCTFFLPDYRGYGFNSGRPTESGLVADCIGAYDTMQSENRFQNGVGLFGISLGGGAAFAVAEQRSAEKIVTLSTFTSMDDMARELFPWPIHLGCMNHWPNDSRLAELLTRPKEKRPSEIVLFHGKADELIPFAMGERLAKSPGAESPESGVRFIGVPRAGHPNVIDVGFEQVARALNPQIN